MDTSVFMDLAKTPGAADLEISIGSTYPIWMEIRNFVFDKYSAAIEEWHVAVKKYGWSFRIKDKKRAIIYLSPRKGFFKVAMVFGQKASNQIFNSEINEFIKCELMNSKVYVEGRVLSIDVLDLLYLNDIKKLVEIKLAN